MHTDDIQLPQLLARNIRARRKQLGMSQEALALEAGIDRTFVSQIERAIGNPSLLTLSKIAATLHVKVIALLKEPEIS